MKNIIQILTVFFIACSSLSIYANDELCYWCSQDTNHLEPALESFIGIPIDYFRIDSSNSSGETVGMAFFKNPDTSTGTPERIAWYWHPENGFCVIASRTTLRDSYKIDKSSIPFEFFKLAIND